MILKTSLLIFGSLLLAACASTAPVVPADLVLTGGHVITMNPAQPSARAVAVRGSEVVRVGSAEDVARLIGSGTRVIELNERAVIPGLIEGHGHFLSLGRSKTILDLSNVEAFSDVVAQVAEAVQQADPGTWIFGRGWHQDKWRPGAEVLVEGVPVNVTLNAVSPHNPVLLGHASGHAAFANAAALARADIGPSTEDPPGGTIVRDRAGQATGLLRETAQALVQQAAQAALDARSESERAEEFRRYVVLAGEEALRYGVTSFHDAGASFADIDGFKALERDGALPVRLYVMVRGESNASMTMRLADYYMPMEGNDFLTVRSIKRQLDGALGAHGAWLLEPYEDLPSTSGLVLEPLAEIEQTAHLAMLHGFQVNTHAIGTRANRELLDLYARVFTLYGGNGATQRWRVEHAQHVHPEDIPRFAELGVIASVQGVHCTSDGPWIPSRLGEQRTEQTSYRWRDLLDSGARVGNGTDAPVERLDPFASIQASVARVMANGEAFYPRQAMTVEEALASYTIWNAHAAFEEHAKGSLEVGKLADLVVLSKDPTAIPATEIAGIRALYTVVGGEVRFAAE